MQINASQSVVYDEVPGAVEYDFQLSDVGFVPLNTFENFEVPLITARELFGTLPHGTYFVQCRADDGTGPSAWSPIFSVEFTALSPPANPRVE